MEPQFYVLFAVLLVAALIDWRKGVIYNWLTMPAMLVGFGIAIWQAGLYGIVLSLLGFLIGALALFFPFYMGKIGGGDLKLMAAVGAIAGPLFVSETLFISILLGGVYGFMVLILKRGLGTTLNWFLHCWFAVWHKVIYRDLKFRLPASLDGGSMPFGVSILVGALIAYKYEIFELILSA